MDEISVDFIHPTDGRLMTATLDRAITAQEVIGELLASNFIDQHDGGYFLVAKGTGAVIRSAETFAEAQVVNGDILRIVRSTNGGGHYVKDYDGGQHKVETGIPGLDKRTVKQFSIEDIRNSPEALIMIVNLYDDLQLRHEKLSTDLERERSRSRDRFVAALLLLISQIVLAIGANLLTANKGIAIPVLVAGGLQASLALYLTFRKPSTLR